MYKYLCTLVYPTGMLNNVQISRVHPTNLLDIKRMVGRIRERIGRERKREPAVCILRWTNRRDIRIAVLSSPTRAFRRVSI